MKSMSKISIFTKGNAQNICVIQHAEYIRRSVVIYSDYLQETKTKTKAKTKLNVLKEQRYKDDGNGGKVTIEGRPVDIKINNYFTTTSIPKRATHRHLYIDFTVVNIFKNTYIDATSKKRRELARLKENIKMINIIII